MSPLNILAVLIILTYAVNICPAFAQPADEMEDKDVVPSGGNTLTLDEDKKEQPETGKEEQKPGDITTTKPSISTEKIRDSEIGDTVTSTSKPPNNKPSHKPNPPKQTKRPMTIYVPKQETTAKPDDDSGANVIELFGRAVLVLLASLPAGMSALKMAV